MVLDIYTFLWLNKVKVVVTWIIQTFGHRQHNSCCYLDRLNLWASTAQPEPVKGQSDDGGPVASSMIKLEKYEEDGVES